MVKPKVNGAVLHENGAYFVLIDTPDCEDDESAFGIGIRNEASIEVRVLCDVDEFVSVETLPKGTFGNALACALTANGKLVFTDGFETWSELVPEDAFNSDGARLKRRLRKVFFVYDKLIVTGFGSQVYLKELNGKWLDASFEVSELVGGTSLFYHALPGDGDAIIFAGIFVHDRTLSDELKDASASGNAKLFREIKRAQRKQDHMLVATYDGEWSVNFADYPGVVSWIWRNRHGSYYLVSDTGIVWLTDDFLDLVELSQPSKPQPFDDIKPWGGEPLFCLSNQLFRVSRDGLQPFSPMLPIGMEAPECLCVNSATLALLQENSILILEDGSWIRLEFTMD